jgi:ABC-type multidrug transport system permease subunit
MGFLLAAAEKDLRRHLRDPMALVLWLGIPLLIGGLITLVMGGMDKAPPTAHLLIADQDGGRLSWLLAKAFGDVGSSKFLHVEEAATEEQGRACIGRGEATGLLVIPAGFIEAALKEQPTTLVLVTNPAQRILPQMVEETLEMAADGAFYVQRLAGPEVRKLALGPPKGKRTFSNEEITRVSVAFNKLAERLNRYLFPPVIEVETVIDDASAGPKVSITQLFLPGVLFMALVFMSEGLSADVWRERDQGTLRRSACTPAATVALLAGKMLAAATLMLGCSFVVLLAGMLYLGLPLTKLPLLLAWSVCSGLLFLLILQLIQMHASSQRAAGVLTNSIAMPLLFIGGSFFPFEVMPEWMATIGTWTPNGWALAHLKEILSGREVLGRLGAAFAAVITIGSVLFMWSERRLRVVFARR